MAFDNQFLREEVGKNSQNNKPDLIDDLRNITENALIKQKEDAITEAEKNRNKGRNLAKEIIRNLPWLLKTAAEQGKYETEILVVVDEYIMSASQNSAKFNYMMLFELGPEGRDEAAAILTEHLEMLSLKVRFSKEFDGRTRVQNLVLYADWGKENN
jgi:hypothetical protein